MTYLLYFIIATATFFFMEGVAWFTHKYIMHGFLWTWHESHHKPHEHFFEKNDYFAVVFSIPSMATIMLGVNVPWLWFLLPIGFGILGYGIFYVVFHDIIVHRRLKIKFVAKSRYLQRMIRAHHVHHRCKEKEGAEAFGFLYAPKKYEPKH
ncbi:sterol desaturase family protein [Eisenibacter elegans]|jgi:beta-carotene 3-hydroxylase|uniref:sterol desaturase family protein n=1 Tax=Eisenibacter elegans TaxID=997 RepID=UPI000420BB39|nr:sterol desaturase family protein [Eisenibacter elegans]